MFPRTASCNPARRKRKTRMTASRLRRSRLLTEVMLRKINLDPRKTERMSMISEQFKDEDIAFFKKMFDEIDTDKSGILLRTELHEGLLQLGISTTDKELDEYLLIADADGSKAIDFEEWIVLCGMLVRPPQEKNEIIAAFQTLFPYEEDVPVVVFRRKMQKLLENAYAHQPECNPHEVSCFVDDIISALDPNNTGCIDFHESIRILSASYNRVSVNTSVARLQQQDDKQKQHQQQQELPISSLASV